MPIGTANNKLRLKVLYNLLCMSNLQQCSKCGGKIEEPENFSIIHKDPWIDSDVSLFWSLDNIAFSHQECGAARHGEKNMTNNIIKVEVIDEHGQELRTFIHEGMTYVAGEKGQRYNLRVKNMSWDRIEVVSTVDGKDVMSGEPGNYIEQTGYLIKPYNSILIDGIRQTDDEVAAFRFSGKQDSYAAQMSGGNTQNLGVIGFAVFKEKQPVITVSNTSYQQYGSGPPKIRGGNFLLGDSSPDVEGNLADVHFSTLDAEPVTCGPASTSKGVTRSVGSGIMKPASVQNLGTEFGETVSSSVTKVSFTRKNKEVANETFMITYDTLDGLRARGVPVDKVQSPNPFPGMPDPTAGYAKPPPRRRR